MKINLQPFEPLHQPAGTVATAVVAAIARKPGVRLTPVVSDNRLFHAWRA